MNTLAVQEGVDAFYGDFRNQSVCWYDAYKFAAIALNGDAPGGAEELDAALRLFSVLADYVKLAQ